MNSKPLLGLEKEIHLNRASGLPREKKKRRDRISPLPCPPDRRRHSKAIHRRYPPLLETLETAPQILSCLEEDMSLISCNRQVQKSEFSRRCRDQHSIHHSFTIAKETYDGLLETRC